MWQKLNKTSIGIVGGLVLPIIVFFVYYEIKYNAVSFSSFVAQLWEFKLLIKLLSLCVLPNLLLFYLFIQKNLLWAARGVLIACFLFAFIVLGFRLIA